MGSGSGEQVIVEHIPAVSNGQFSEGSFPLRDEAIVAVVRASSGSDHASGSEVSSWGKFTGH